MQIGFIDFSREERNKMLAALRELSDKAAVDELGIGSIRDGYAEQLFPGISTGQTRAKYFVLLPPLIKKSAEEAAQKGKTDPYQILCANEDKLARALIRANPSSTGIIGRNAVRANRSVIIKPSSLYWTGLKKFKILENQELTVAEACDALMSSAAETADQEYTNDDKESMDDPSAKDSKPVIFSPFEFKKDFDKMPSIKLSYEEAKFLEEKIIDSTDPSCSMLAFLIKNRIRFNDFRSIPDRLLQEPTRTVYLLAKDFADFIFIGHLRYNMIFSQYKDKNVETLFQKNLKLVKNLKIDLESIFSHVKVDDAVKNFCNSLLECAIKSDMNRMDELIVSRERALKGARAKLRKPLEYEYKTPIHCYKLDYRGGTAKVMIDDILDGLGQ